MSQLNPGLSAGQDIVQANQGTPNTSANAWPVNVVAGGAGGGIAETQVQNASGTYTPVGYASGNETMPVSGTFWQTTQPVSASSLPLPTGAALETGGNLATLTTDTSQRYGGGLTPYAKILTASDTITPASGKSLQVNWVAFIPDSDNSSANQVTVGFNAGATLYIGYAMSHWEPFTGAVNQVLDITLANAQPVSVMVQYKSV